MTPVTEYVPSWTRNEDKIILEEIKKGCSDKNEMMEKLDELIEGRDKSEIKKRYDFLLDIVSMMQPSKVH